MVAARPLPVAQPPLVLHPTPLSRPQRYLGLPDLPVLLVALFGIVLAGWLYYRFLGVSDNLWYSSLHDRSAHLWLGISLAIDLRTFDLPHLLKDLHAARIWGPLHPLLVGIVLAIGGLDERLAVLPSLACWVGSGVFAFLAARRASPQGGNLAGFVAALFVLASPAFRAFATDIMLESLGACLSLGVLYFYLRLRQEQTEDISRGAGSAAGLGLMLTLLFFDKYNYWLLMLLPLIADSVGPHLFDLSSKLLLACHRFQPRAWLLSQLRHPLTWVLMLLGLVLLLPLWTGDVLHLAGQEISLRSPHNTVSVMVWVVFLRLWPWWWNRGCAWRPGPAFPASNWIYWHVVPLVVWFLWPQRLGNCLVYLTRNHGIGESSGGGFLGGLACYWTCLGEHYLAAPWLSWFIVALFLSALPGPRRLRPGASLIFWVLLVAGTMTLLHPTIRSRFLHSWIAVLWVAAGVGLVQLLHGRLIADRPLLHLGLAGTLVALLVGVQASSLTEMGRAPEGGPKEGRPLVLDLVRPVLPELDQDRPVVVVSNQPLKFLTGWMSLQRAGKHGWAETDPRGFGADPAGNQPAFERWLQTTRCAAVVFIEVPAGSVFEECRLPSPYAHFPAWLEQQQVFQQVQQWRFPQHGGVRVTLWKRTAPSPGDPV